MRNKLGQRIEINEVSGRSFINTLAQGQHDSTSPHTYLVRIILSLQVGFNTARIVV